jgi:hypothetical protein
MNHAILWYEPGSGQVMSAPSMVEGRALDELTPLFPGWRWVEIPADAIAAMHDAGAASFYVERAAGKPAEKHFMSASHEFRVILKRPTELKADRERIGVGEVVTVKWDAPDPVKLWVDHMPIAGPQLGKFLSPYRFTASRSGLYKLHLRDTRYRAEPLYIHVS